MTDQAPLYKALVAAQKKAQAVKKESTNSFHKYKYASAEAVIEEARGALSEAGLCVFHVGWSIVPAVEGRLGAVVVKYRMAHESGATLDFEPCETACIPEKGRPEDKAEATALTYNLGYFLRGLLLLPREDAAASVDARNDTNYEPKKPEPIDEAKAALLADEFRQALAAVTAIPDLVKIGAAIKDAADVKRTITAAHRAELLEKYKARTADLTGNVKKSAA